MKAILEEYGMMLVTIAITLIFILFSTPFGNTVVDYVEDSLAKFYSEAMTQKAPEISGVGSESGEQEDELNEYGFYYDRLYRSKTQSDGGYITIIFHEDGTGIPTMYDGDGNSQVWEFSNLLVYEKNKITNGDIVMEIQDNGKTVTNAFWGTTVYLVEDNEPSEPEPVVVVEPKFNDVNWNTDGTVITVNVADFSGVNNVKVYVLGSNTGNSNFENMVNPEGAVATWNEIVTLNISESGIYELTATSTKVKNAISGTGRGAINVLLSYELDGVVKYNKGQFNVKYVD